MAFLFFILQANPVTRLPYWPFILCLLLASVVFYTRAMSPNHWRLVIRSTMSSRAVQQLIREENILENTYSGMLLLAFFFSLSLFLQNTNEFFELTISFHSLLIFLYILVGVFFIYVTKAITLYFLQWVFQEGELFEEYLVSLLNINIVLGVALIPLNILIIYGMSISAKPLIYIGLTLLALSFLLRLTRIVEMGRNREMKSYNIILYLCTLEIIPILLLLKLMENLGIGQLTL